MNPGILKDTLVSCGYLAHKTEKVRIVRSWWSKENGGDVALPALFEYRLG